MRRRWTGRGLLIVGLMAIAVIPGVAATHSNDLVLHYPLNAGSGQVIGDTSGNGNDGIRGWFNNVETKDPSWDTTAAEGSYSLRFDGADHPDGDVAQGYSDPALNPPNITVAAQIRPKRCRKPGNSISGIIDKEGQYRLGLYKNGGRCELVAAVNGGGSCTGDWCDNPGDGYGDWVSSGYDIPMDTWSDVIVTWNETHYTFYVDDTRVHQERPDDLTGSAQISSSSQNLGIGAASAAQTAIQDPYAHFQGRIDDIRIYRRAISGQMLTNKAPIINNPSPANTSTSSSDPTTVSANVTDLEGASVTAWIYDEAGTLLGTDTFLNGGPDRADAQYGGLTLGQTYEWIVNASDGDRNTTRRYEFTYDNTPPTTTDNWTVSGWQPGTAYIELSATDTESSVASISYRIDGGPWTTVNDNDATFHITSSGNHTLEYNATDVDGFTESTNHDYVAIDNTLPSTSIASPNPGIPQSSDFDVDVRDSDSHTGVQTCRYRIRDPAAGIDTGWQLRTGSNCPSGPGDDFTVTVGPGDICQTEGKNVCLVNVTATDAAGNTAADWAWFDIDYSALTSSDNYTDGNLWKNSPQPIELTCDNGGIPCGLEWRVRNGTHILWSDFETDDTAETQVGWADNGNLTLEYRANDTLGNVELPPNDQTVLIDKIRPWTHVWNSSTWYSDDFTLTETAGEMTDRDWGGSGIDPTDCWYQTKDGTGGSWSGWKSRSCDEVTITVGKSAALNECSTDGAGECWVRTRAYDNASNRAISQAAALNIDLDAPVTSNNYTDNEWKVNAQPIEITCTDTETTCQNIEWWVIHQNGTQIEPAQNDSGTSTEVKIGDDGLEHGEVYLYHRGWDTRGHLEDPPKKQRVRVDVHGNGSKTTIEEPDPDAWYNDDFSVNVTDTASISGLGTIDLYYLIDISWSFRDEWYTMAENLTYIEKEVESRTGRDVDSRVWGLNNSYLAGAGSRSMCMPGQDNRTVDWDNDGTEEQARGCEDYTRIIDGVTNIDAYVDFINDEFSRSLVANPNIPPGSYNPLHTALGGSQPTMEAPREGWGVGMLQIIANEDWTQGSRRVIINIGDQDTNGGNETHSKQGSNCGDIYSEAVADNLTLATENKNITTYSLIGDSECGDPWNPAYDQMDRISDDWDNYDDAEDLPPKIINELEDINATGCKYRVTDAGTGQTTDWQERGCPDGNFTVTVGPPGSGAMCTTEGEDMCIVETKVNNTAGFFDMDTKRYNIDYTAPNVSCDDCDSPDPLMIGNKVSFSPNVTDRPQSGGAGVDNVTICTDSVCSTVYCRFTAGGLKDACSYRTSFDDGYGPHPYCIYASDILGNSQTYCNPQWRFTILAGVGDPCDTDQQCMIGVCDQGRCRAESVPPPGIILH